MEPCIDTRLTQGETGNKGEQVNTREARQSVAPSVVVSLVALAVVFAVGLTFASVELPRLISGWLMRIFEFPGFDSGRNVEQTEAFVSCNGLRVVGYLGLSAVAVMIVAGLALERRRFAVAGAVALFLPVFGHFAASMFFLAGLGVLRVLFLPVMDRSYDLMALGEVAFVPYMAVVYPFACAGVDIREAVIWAAMAGGMLLFIAGVLAWCLTKFRGVSMAEGWVYRISRHPQYLGWIIWSWGLLLYVSRHSELYQFKISYGVPSSLPWLLSAMAIIGVALCEEVAMERRLGDDYRRYTDRTPFLMPLPRWLRTIVAAPMKWVLGSPSPESGRDVIRIVALYTVILILLSVPFVIFGWPAATGWYAFPYNVTPFASAG